MEFFEAIKTFITATHSGKNGFKEVSGIQLSDDYFAYKDGVRSETWWWIVDIKSGLAIPPKHNSLKDCKEWLKNISEEDLAKIEQKKLEPFYQEQCVKLAAWKPVETESLDFDIVFEALNDLYNEVDQEVLEWD